MATVLWCYLRNNAFKKDKDYHVSAVILGELLLDDVGFDGHAEMVSLAGEVGGDVIVLVFFEGIVAQVAPQDGGHAELVRVCEGLADFDNLAAALVGAEIDGGANRGGAQVVGLLHGAKENLIGLIGEGQQLVVINLHDERDFVSILARDRAEHAK